MEIISTYNQFVGVQKFKNCPKLAKTLAISFPRFHNITEFLREMLWDFRQENENSATLQPFVKYRNL